MKNSTRLINLLTEIQSNMYNLETLSFGMSRKLGWPEVTASSTSQPPAPRVWRWSTEVRLWGCSSIRRSRWTGMRWIGRCRKFSTPAASSSWSRLPFGLQVTGRFLYWLQHTFKCRFKRQSDEICSIRGFLGWFRVWSNFCIVIQMIKCLPVLWTPGSCEVRCPRHGGVVPFWIMKNSKNTRAQFLSRESMKP